MRRERKRNKIIIIILIGIIFLMGVGYAAFQTRLNITGTSNISSDWNIRIISADVTDTGGAGENVKNTYNDLSASLEANLYEKGDYVEYSIIVENKGTFDAKLETIGIIDSNNEAVKITSTGLTKGQILYQNSTATLKVKIEYNSSYEGDASGTSGEAKIDLDFVQNSGGTIKPENNHLVTYDYSTNGGSSTNAENEYINEGESINLSYTATKEGYDFIGWNTNKDAQEGLKELTMGTSDIILYAIFKKPDTTPPVIENVSTSSTTNSITVVVTASDEESGISKYEFKLNDEEWIDNGTSNTYTFAGLTQDTGYGISVRVTNGVDLTAEEEVIESIKLTDNVVTTGDGLYKDSTEEGRYIYRGASPNNYVNFNHELWRIISVETDGTMKIVKDDVLPNKAWDTSNSNNWARPATLNTYLNGDYYNSLTQVSKNQITEHNFGIGEVTWNNTNLTDQIADENETVWTGRIGLITASDYIRSNTNENQCGNFSKINTNYSTCKNTTYLFTGSQWWIFSPASNGTSSRNIKSDGQINSNPVNTIDNYRPALYLKNSIDIIGGKGTNTEPYNLGTGVSTSVLNVPTFSEEETDNGKTVTITYPKGEGLTYEYQINDGAWTIATQIQQLDFTEESTIVARVSDGTNTVTSSSHTVTVTPPGTEFITDLVSTNPDELYTDEHGDIRYYGANPNNYVRFNNELWRIMGVIDGKIKIVRNASIGNRAWNSSYSNNWNNSSLKSYLNGDYYNSIEEVSRNMIASETYYLGGATRSNHRTLTASGYYNAERSTTVYSGNPTSTTQYIGLMYPSDYGYAAGESCLSTALYNYDGGCKKTDYLRKGVNQWLQAPCASGSDNAAVLYSTDFVNGYLSNVTPSYAVFPVLYLESQTMITGGEGSSDSPFILG